MKQHLGDLTPHSVYIYHHYWPEIPLNPMRREVRTMGYQGNPAYLGRWQALLEKIALEKGMSFVINPSDWSSIDIGIAMRDGVHASFLATHYKSNVKLANFYGSGTPCLISSHERACQETDNGEALFFRSEEDFKRQMDLLGDYSRRLRIHESFLKTRSQFHIEAIANIYEHYFQTLYRNVVKAG
jgi:hypothetical protein